MKRRAAQRKITSLAKGRECQIRIPGVCAATSETVVPCHYRLSGLSGMNWIPEALFVAYGCHLCHSYVDSHRDAETRLMFAEGVFRSQSLLLDEGVIIVMNSA